MPEQSYPPYASGSLISPRTLNRWLDVNAQNGSLRRTQTYVTLPAFNVANSWNGYSDIVASFNVEAGHNFSLKTITAPSDANYALCISFRVQGAVTRYLLWDATGSNFNQTIPAYTNQTIKKNFRFEVWNTSQGATTNASALAFLTSKLGEVDYRYGTDSALASTDAENDSFNATDKTATTDAPPQTGLLVNFRADDVSGSDWTGRKYYLGNSNWQTNPVAAIPTKIVGGVKCVDLTTVNFAELPINPFTVFDGSVIVFLIYGFGTAVGLTDFLDFDDNVSASQFAFYIPPVANQININDGIMNTTASDSTLAVAFFPNDNLAITGTVPNYVNVGNCNPAVAGGNQVTSIKLNAAPVYVAEILIYDANTVDANLTDELVLYMSKYYSNNSLVSFTVPITFPSTSVSTTN